MKQFRGEMGLDTLQECRDRNTKWYKLVAIMDNIHVYVYIIHGGNAGGWVLTYTNLH